MFAPRAVARLAIVTTAAALASSSSSSSSSLRATFTSGAIDPPLVHTHNKRFAFGDGARKFYSHIMGNQPSQSSAEQQPEGEGVAGKDNNRGATEQSLVIASSDLGSDTDAAVDRSNDSAPCEPAAEAPSRRGTYVPPTSPVKPAAHYVFLVHGWLGNDLEMAYLSQAFRNALGDGEDEKNGDAAERDLHVAKRTKRSSSRLTRLLSATDGKEIGESHPEIVVHSVKCNVGKTHDGIRNGGTRLANEIVDFIQSDMKKRLAHGHEGADGEEHVTFSMVGNSLGGLYSRYAISLLPCHLQIALGDSSAAVTLHPNVFCTTATPHLGISRNTFIPIPRVAEAMIGTGMGKTGRDLFRLDSQKDLASEAAGGIVGAAVGGVTAAGGAVKRLSACLPNSPKAEGTDLDAVDTPGTVSDHGDDDEEMKCVIRNMCLQERFLSPLRDFRRRIAYANAYGTDFQVPIETAAFLHERSGVGHFVLALRDPSAIPKFEKDDAPAEDDGGATKTDCHDDEGVNVQKEEVGDGEVPPFVVAVVRTERQSQPQSPTKANSGNDAVDPSDELLRMSQSLDALGWTKVFLDVRDRIPIPGLAKPAWMRPKCGSLDELVRERAGMEFDSLSKPTEGDSTPKVEKVSEELCILTSQELAQSTRSGDSLNFPLGHTVMVANSKNEQYSQLNSKGRPVMDGLAEGMVESVLKFE